MKTRMQRGDRNSELWEWCRSSLSLCCWLAGWRVCSTSGSFQTRQIQSKLLRLFSPKDSVDTDGTDLHVSVLSL